MKNRKGEELRVVAAAIRKRSGIVFTLPPPARHGGIIYAMAKAGVEAPILDEQGFLLNDGTFCKRGRAFRVASDAGQIIKKTAPTDLLFSEDLW